MWESWPWRCGTFCRADYVNLGYRGVDADNSRGTIKHCGKYKTLTATERKLLKRRQVIEPIIGRSPRGSVGEQGDSLNAVLCATKYNIRWLPRMKKGIAFVLQLYLRLCQTAAVRPN